MFFLFLCQYPRQKGDSPPLVYGSSNTDIESLGRTPPATRHANRNKQKGNTTLLSYLNLLLIGSSSI